jgi:8-oxo-dGTP pyrophosphatase MutT (NUDIX family)
MIVPPAQQSAPSPRLRPRDAATLIIIDRAGAREPRILMGRRAAHHVFLPRAYVFPGGRVDPGDSLMAAADELTPAVRAKLLVDMKRGASERRARALALAAVRETWEEAGIMIAAKSTAIPPALPDGWQPFGDLQLLPALSALRFVGRAITPPQRPRRFDTRFFAAFRDAVVHSSQDQLAADKLEDVTWLTFAEARQMDLPGITVRMIGHLERRLADDPDLCEDVPLPYYFTHRGKLNEDRI